MPPRSTAPRVCLFRGAECGEVVGRCGAARRHGVGAARAGRVTATGSTPAPAAAVEICEKILRNALSVAIRTRCRCRVCRLATVPRRTHARRFWIVL
jgi:hypothetical protein